MIFGELSKRFDEAEGLKDDMINLAHSITNMGGTTYLYNPDNDTFTLEYQAESGEFFLVGYIYNGGNK